MKAKDFWEFLCEELGYRFFSGVPCLGLKPLYDTMHPNFMHYVPAVNESVALALASGAALSGNKAAVLMDFDRLYNTLNCVSSFNFNYNVPVLVLAFNGSGNKDLKKLLKSQSIPYRTLKNIKSDLTALSKDMHSKKFPVVALLEEGTIS
jgi:phosphonopyruvate decarboxylase